LLMLGSKLGRDKQPASEAATAPAALEN